MRFTLMTVIQLSGECCLGYMRHNMEIFSLSAEFLSKRSGAAASRWSEQMVSQSTMKLRAGELHTDVLGSQLDTLTKMLHRFLPRFCGGRLMSGWSSQERASLSSGPRGEISRRPEHVCNGARGAKWSHVGTRLAWAICGIF